MLHISRRTRRVTRFLLFFFAPGYAFVVTFRHAFSVFNILFYLIYLFVPETRGAF